MRNIGAGKAKGQLLAAQAQALDPLVGHRAKIGRVRMCLFAGHEVRGWVRQVLVELAEIGENEALDLTGALRRVQPVNRSVLPAIKDRAEDAQHACDDELAWRVLPQAVARRA